jgi:hypothetical protein
MGAVPSGHSCGGKITAQTPSSAGAKPSGQLPAVPPSPALAGVGAALSDEHAASSSEPATMERRSPRSKRERGLAQAWRAKRTVTRNRQS